METNKRAYRSRDHRVPIMKRFGVTENEKRRILDPLLRYARLPTPHIVALYGSTYAKAVLKKLWQETGNLPPRAQILYRPDGISKNGVGAKYHELGPAALELLNADPDWYRRTKIGRAMHSAHDLQINMEIASIEAAANRAKIPFVGHLEIFDYPKCSPTARQQRWPVSFPYNDTWFEPDALFGLKTDSYKFFVVELDRHTEQWSIIDAKMDAYDHILDNKLYQSHLGLPNMRVLWMADDLAHLHGIRKRVRKHHDAHLFHVVERFELFQSPPTPSLHHLTDDWQTASGKLVKLI